MATLVWWWYGKCNMHFCVFLIAYFVGLQLFSSFPHPLFSLSLPLGNIITNLFCQLNMERLGCLCDLKVAAWIFKEVVAFCFCSAVRVPVIALALPDRNEVSKLKFEAKTFHIYANQKEVSKWIYLMCLALECGFLSQLANLSRKSPYLCCAGQKDYFNILCAHARGMQAPLEVWCGESGVLQVSLQLSYLIRLFFRPLSIPEQCQTGYHHITMVSLKPLPFSLFINWRSEMWGHADF